MADLGPTGPDRRQLPLPGDHDRPRHSWRSSPTSSTRSRGCRWRSCASRSAPRSPSALLRVLYGLSQGDASLPLTIGSVLASRDAELGIAGLRRRGVRLVSAFGLVGRVGFGPLARPPEPDDPTADLEPPPPAPEGWLRLGAGYGPARRSGLAVGLLVIPVVLYVISYIPWAIVEQPPAGRQLAGRAHRPDAPRPHAGDVRLPQLPARDAPGVVAVVGVAVRPQAGLVLRRRASPAARPARSTTPATSSAWWLAIPAMAFIVLAGLQAAEPGARVRRHRVSRASGLPWARIDRATFQYHYYTIAAVRVPGPRLLPRRAVARPVRRTWLLARLSAAALRAPAVRRCGCSIGRCARSCGRPTSVTQTRRRAPP